MTRTARSTLMIVAALALSACGGRMKRENAQALAAADGRVLVGCYDCLREARDAYARLASARHVNRDTILLRLFETEVLLALREKELGLDATASLGRAAAMVTRLPPAVDAPRVLAMANAVLPDATGRPADWLAPLRLRHADYLRTVPDEVTRISAGPLALRKVFRDYLALALDCSYGGHVMAPRAPPGAPHRRPVVLADAPPIIMYRSAICLGIDANLLAGVLAADSTFHEAAYFAGVRSAFTAEEDGGAEGWKLLGLAYARWPRITGLTYMAGYLFEQVGDCAAALRFFDETLVLDAEHELALLERTVCLSRLHRDTAAIESATRLLELGRSKRLAHYWRAVSLLRLREVDRARADIESAKALGRTAEVLTVAGVIENEQNDLSVAEKDLVDARKLALNDENCTAIWTLGLVLRKAGRPGESAQAFEDGMRCHELRIGDAVFRMRRIRAQPSVDAAYATKRIASLEADTVDHRSRYHASAFNAAGSIANAGKLERALELLAVAARDPRLSEPVGELRSAIVAAQRR